MNLITHVREHILATMPDGSVSADRVASQLNISRRTLTRQLAGEGTSYRCLLDAARRECAQHYLETTDITVDRIAHLLGFSESAAFIRAYRRWTDMTPALHRRIHRSGMTP